MARTVLILREMSCLLSSHVSFPLLLALFAVLSLRLSLSLQQEFQASSELLRFKRLVAGSKYGWLSSAPGPSFCRLEITRPCGRPVESG